MLGIPTDAFAFDGTSLLPDLMGRARPERFVYAEVPQQEVGDDDWRIESRAIKWGDTKLIEMPGKDRTLMLRDTDRERGFRGPDARAARPRLRAALDERVRQLGVPPPREAAPDFSLSEETAEALRAFGYLDDEE